ncbi:MAG: hypothetical protein LBP55_04475 [Candidatus Adiutrix sp.]|jgi:hypothetical protein|nr:hypothetical protein [Candidatus Adiutrix sp.]
MKGARRILLIAGLALLGLAGTTAETPALAPGEFLDLKESFEDQARATTDPQQLACLGAETTALAWSLAAIRLTEDPEAQNQWRERAAEFKQNRQERDWDDRHLDALELYYQALREAALYLVTRHQQPALALELRRIDRQTLDKINLLLGRPEVRLEKRVILSGALAALVSVAVRSLGGGPTGPLVRRIIQGLISQAEEVSGRSELHYRARLSLLYVGNLQTLTALVLLLGQSAGPPLSQELAALHRSLNEHGPGLGLPDAVGLIWTAQAQAALPLAFWLSEGGPAAKTP